LAAIEHDGRRVLCRGVGGSTTDQGSRFTSFAFTHTLMDSGIRISMDGRGRWMDNVFTKRLWRSLKYECVFLNAFDTGSEARSGMGRWIGYYNIDRPHSALAAGRPMRSMLSTWRRNNWRRNQTQNPP
jgi:putative transposase